MAMAQSMAGTFCCGSGFVGQTVTLPPPATIVSVPEPNALVLTVLALIRLATAPDSFLAVPTYSAMYALYFSASLASFSSPRCKTMR